MIIDLDMDSAFASVAIRSDVPDRMPHIRCTLRTDARHEHSCTVIIITYDATFSESTDYVL